MGPTFTEPPREPRRRRARRPRALLATGGTALLALACIATAAAVRGNSAGADQVRTTANVRADAASALTDNWYASAPYYSVLDSAAPDLGTVMSATGQKAFDMAFILADGSGSPPAWKGTDPTHSGP